MSWISYLNIVLWAIDTVAIASLTAIYFWFTKTYQSWHVWQINTGNDVINSTELNQIVKEFRILLNLKKYKIVFVDDDKHHKLFSNLKKSKKQIVINKQIFVSVGYELDYLISRLWLSSQEIKKSSLIRWYKILVKYLPTILIVLGFLSYLFNTFIFVIGLTYLDSLDSKFINFLWYKPVVALLTMIFFGLLGLVFYGAVKVKAKVELAYNQEILGLAKKVLDTYYLDFTAARQYAQRIQIPFLLTFHSKREKWLGPFTY